MFVLCYSDSFPVVRMILPLLEYVFLKSYYKVSIKMYSLPPDVFGDLN